MSVGQLLRDGGVRVRREAVRALCVLSEADVAPERAEAIAEALYTILFIIECTSRG